VTARGELWPGGPVALPADVRLGDELYRVRPIPTHELLYALSAGDWTRLVPRALSRRDMRRVAIRLYDPADALDFPHLWEVATALGGRLAAVDVAEGHDPGAGWWPAHRIAAFVVTHWLSFDGWCVRRGFDPHTAPLGRIIAAGWQFMIDHRPTEGSGKDAKQITVEALRTQVWTPPGIHRKQVMRFTASQERAAALAALRDVLPS
jgi:hypothetical protein